MSNVKIFRLTTGEDLIAVKEEKSSVSVSYLKQPFVIIPMQSKPGGPVQLQMTPYMPYSDDRVIKIDNDKIIAEVEPKIDLKNSYNQNTGVGIIQAAKPKLIVD
jgi:hypothetical protein